MTEQTSSPLGAISNIMLGVADLERSMSFYRDLMGLSVHFQSPGFAFLDGGSVVIALSEPLHQSSEHSVGATEIVFTVEDVKATFEILKERGVDFINDPRPVTPTEHAANFCDPDGHRLSIFGHYPET